MKLDETIIVTFSSMKPPQTARHLLNRKDATITAMRIPLVFVAALMLCSGLWAADADPASDAPAPRTVPAPPVSTPASYAQALSLWHIPEDVNAWIGARFEYENERALLLSESGRAAGPAPAIHEPDAFFTRPVGICVDLARFAVETLRRIGSEYHPRYLMIEFSPALRKGQVLRRHWIASFRREEGYYFFADSRFPGKISGPYASVQAFVAGYQITRQREIVSFSQRDSYRRQVKALRERTAASYPPVEITP